MKKEFTLKRYNDIDDLIFAAYKSTEDEAQNLTMQDLKEYECVGLDQNQKEVKFSYQVQKNAIEKQGHWGWICDDKIIHYWIGKKIELEELIHFFAHEIGHQTGISIDDHFQEELRAEGYGETATLAYKFAKEVSKIKY